MAPRLSKVVAEEIDEILEAEPNVDLNEVAAVYNTTYKSVCERRKGIRKRLATGINSRKRAGPTGKVTPEIREYALWCITKDNQLYEDEVAAHIEAEFDVALHQSTISRLYTQAKITHKALEVEAQQRNEILISNWKGLASSWDAKRLCFIDESAANERTGDRKWGFAPKGRPARAKRWLKKTERLSVLPGYTWQGIQKALVVKGAINAEIFEDWLYNDLLPNLPRHNGLQPIVIMDNARIHRREEIQAICRCYNCLVEFLPPYAPILNSIESSFYNLKAFIRRHYRVGNDGSYTDFEPFLIRTLRAFGDNERAKQKAIAHFKHCGYVFYD